MGWTFSNICCAVLSRSVVPDSLQPMYCQPPGSCPWGFSRQEYWSRLPCTPPGIKSRSPALQVNSLLSELPWKPMNTGVGTLSLLQGIFWAQESNQGLLHCRWILYQLNYQGSPLRCTHISKHHVVALKHNFYMSKIYVNIASLVVQMVKHLPAVQETQVRSLGQEDPLEKEMAAHSSALA